jgi:ATP-dependent DNA ligase
VTTGDPIPQPVEVMLARRVERLPEPGDMPGGCAYEPKFDGHRLVVLTGPVRLQTRSGRVVTGTFPEIAEAAEALPPGTVLDGELVIWREGKLDFGALQKRSLRGLHTPAANYAAFDLLACNGLDWRSRPYEERRLGLTSLLGPLGPPLQPVPVTADRAEAESWYAGLAANGIEGLVVKGRAQRYRPGRRDWLKLRHSVPQDAVAIGTAESSLVVDLGDGPVETAPLDAGLRAELAALPVPPRPDAPLPVEVLQGTGRHGLITVLRLRPAG